MEGNEASSLIQSGEIKEMADVLLVATCVLPSLAPPLTRPLSPALAEMRTPSPQVELW